MNIVKELEKLKHELEKNTYGQNHLGVWSLVNLLLKYFKEEIDERKK